MEGSRLEVACATDPRYLPHCAAMLHSLIAHQRRSLHVHVLVSPDLGPGLRGTLSSWLESEGASSTIHQLDRRRFSGIRAHFSVVTWYRTLLPELLPEIDRVIFLDCDLIVKDSLDPLWRLDLGGNYLAAVTNPPLNLRWMEKHCSALGLPTVDDYFNVGVMLLDLRALRAGRWPERILEYGIENFDRERADAVNEDSSREVFVYALQHPERHLFADQDAHNALLWDRRLKLHPRWNYQNLFTRSRARTRELTQELITEAGHNPAIRHFEGPGHSKPWHKDAAPEASTLYRRHSQRTPWPSH